MKILVSSPGASLFGAERVLLAMARGLADRGHAVTLEFPHDGPGADAAAGIDGCARWIGNRPRLPRDARELAAYLGRTPGAYRRMRRQIASRGFDLAWVHSIFNPFVALAARRAGLPVVWHLHEKNFIGPAGWALAAWVRYCAAAPVAVSRYVAGSFEAVRPLRGRVRVLHNALITPMPTAAHERRAAGSGPQDGRAAGERPAGAAGAAGRRGDAAFVIGYVGQFEPRKRAADVVEAVAEMPRAAAVLVGDGKARPRIEAAVRRRGVRDRVRLTGFQERVAPYYEQFDCVVVPSRNEPFGLVALEAMMAGRPVVAARSGALPEVLGDAALYYPVGKVGRLVRQLRRIRDEPGLEAELCRRAERRLPSFRREAWIGGVERIAAACARSGGGP